MKVARLTRLGRAGVILSAGVRGSRSAGRLLSSRIGTLVAVTIVVILAASQLLYAFETDIGYGIVLYETVLSTRRTADLAFLSLPSVDGLRA